MTKTREENEEPLSDLVIKSSGQRRGLAAPALVGLRQEVRSLWLLLDDLFFDSILGNEYNSSLRLL